MNFPVPVLMQALGLMGIGSVVGLGIGAKVSLPDLP